MQPRKSKFYHTLFLYGIIGGLLPTLICTVLIYAYAARVIRLKARENAEQALTQVQLRMDQLLEMQDRQLVGFLTDSALEAFMSMEPRSTDFELVREINTRLAKTMLYDLGIEDAALYSFAFDWKLVPSGLLRNTRPEAQALPEDSAPYAVWYPSRDPRFLRLARSYPLNARTAAGAFVVDISRNTLRNTLLEGAFPGRLYALDSLGRVLLSALEDEEGLPLAELLQGAADLPEDADASSMETRLNGVPSLIHQRRSDYATWRYVAVVDMRPLLTELRWLQWLVVGLGTVLSGLLAAYAMISSRRLYAPLRALYDQARTQAADAVPDPDEFAVLGLRLEQHLRQSQTLFAYRLFNGEWNEEQIQAYCQANAVCIELPCQVCVVKPDQEMDAQARRSFSGSFENGQGLLADLLQLPPLIMDQTTVLLLGGRQGKALDEAELQARLEKAQVWLLEALDMEASFFVSCPVGRLSEAHAAFLEACALFQRQVQYGRAVVLFASKALCQGRTAAILMPSMDAVSNLLHAMAGQDLSQAEKALDALLTSLYAGDVDGQTLGFVCAKLLMDCLGLLREYQVDREAVEALERIEFQAVSQLKGRESVQAWFLQNLVQPMVQALSKKQSEYEVRLFLRAKERVAACFEEDYTLEQCAKESQCGPHALQRAFKAVVDMSFSAYLNHVRLDMAKRWLAETDMKIAEIAQRLRYSNAQNFVRSFRRQEGMTPGEYRRLKQ